MKKNKSISILLFLLGYSLLQTEYLPAQQTQKVSFYETYRPQYHFSLPDRWMGDPTGMIYYQGNYFLNYGAGLTKDFVHWNFGNPEFQRQEGIGMMSGSAVVDLLNTSGFGTRKNPPIVAVYSELRRSDIMQFQSISYSIDGGKTYVPYDKNPVIDIHNTEFRDPMVFWHEPTQKWIMAVAMAGDTQVRFYNSSNLKDWDYISTFGPYGAQGGVWECPDIFQLPVNGDTHNMKWVLQVGVQPVSGQYFVGDFNGKEFVIDPVFQKQLSVEKYSPSGTVLFDFEKGLDDWVLEGNAFNTSPVSGALQNQAVILNKKGDYFMNSFQGGDAGTGKAISPEFTIQEPYLNFLIGGGNHPDIEAVNLIVDNQIVKSSTGINTETLTWTGWDVRAYQGKKARISIVDNFEGGFGHILADHFMQSRELAVRKRELAPWIDYGPDFYAVRSWSIMKPGDQRRIWIAWMGNWLYAADVPTKPYRGNQSIPRSLKLQLKYGVYSLIQTPVDELKQLRGTPQKKENIIMESLPKKVDFTIQENVYEFCAEIDLRTSSKAGINLCVGANQKVVLYYDPETQEIVLDRTMAGNVEFSSVFPEVYRAPLAAPDGIIKLHVFVDNSTIEVFCNGGMSVLSALIFPDPNATDIEVFSEGGTAFIKEWNFWELTSIWHEKK